MDRGRLRRRRSLRQRDHRHFLVLARDGPVLANRHRPGRKTDLIFSGPFRIVRHPIYALSILLVLGTLATTPTLVMLVIAIVHIACLQFEARREETYLVGKHGRVYADYMTRAGRFFPHTSSFAIHESSSR